MEVLKKLHVGLLEALNIANLQMGLIYTMRKETVYWRPISQSADGYPFCEFTDGSGQSADGSELQKGWNIYMYILPVPCPLKLLCYCVHSIYTVPLPSSMYFLSLQCVVETEHFLLNFK